MLSCSYQKLGSSPNGLYSWYIRYGHHVGIKVVKWTGDYGRAEAQAELDLLRQAYPSGVTPRPFGLVRVMVEKPDQTGWNIHCGIVMQHIDGEEYACEYGRAVRSDHQEELEEELNMVGISCGDYHGGNVIIDKRGKLWRIDFSPSYVRVEETEEVY